MKSNYKRLFMLPSVGMLLIWMIVPLSMTIYFSLIRYNLLYPERTGFVGLDNYEFFVTDEAFTHGLLNTSLMVGSVLIITVCLGLLISLLLNQQFMGRGIARVLIISPFFVMPTVTALLWKNMLMHPVYGVFAWIASVLGFQPIDWLSELPLISIILMLSWQWVPFGVLILLTALQSIDQDQLEAAKIDGATYWQSFWYIVLPFLSRAIAVLVMIMTIFLLSVFAEIYVTTGGGPGFDTTNFAFLIYSQALLNYDIGVASAGGLLAVIFANIVAFFLIKIVGENLVETEKG